MLCNDIFKRGINVTVEYQAITHLEYVIRSPLLQSLITLP